MATVIAEQNNILQHRDVDDNDELVINDNNEENLMNEIIKTSCDNITHNQSKDDSLEKVVKEMNSEVIADCDNVDNNVKNILDSDNTDKDILLESNDQINIVKSSSKKCSSVIDSDSEDSDIGISLPRRRKKTFFDDDSESVISNVSSEKNIIKKKKNKVIVIDDDDNSVSASPNSIEKEESSNKAIKRFETLVDSESDEDEIQPSTFVENDNKFTVLKKGNKSVTKSTSKKKESNRKSSIRASKSEAMRQIHSETQRLIRETELSLPYHRPKPRTLQEFLNRKKVSVTLPNAPTTATKLKISSAIVSKVLEDKEKEAEEFYKSSDSDEEIGKVENPISELTIKDASTSSVGNGTTLLNDVDSTFIENVEKVMTNGNKSSSINEDISHCVSSVNNISEELFIDNNEIKDTTADLSDKIEKTDLDLSENIIHDHSKNDETVVQEIINKLLDLVECEIKKYNEDILEENIVLEKTNEICLEEKENEVLEAIDANISLHEDDNDKLHDQASDDNRDIETSLLENTIEKTAEYVQGLPLPDFIVEEEKSARKQLLLDIKKNVEPRLRGSPGMIIDLSRDVKPNKKGVENLINRFFVKHTANDKNVEETTEINVLHIENTTDGLKPVKRSLLYKKPIIEKEDPELSKPGAKLKRLKENLKLKMAMKRNEEWKQKEQEEKDKDELEEDDVDTDNNEIEEKLLDESSTSGESEPEENDIPMVDKEYKPLCEFADDEAMESEIEDDDNEVEEEEKEEEEEEEEEEEDEEEEEEEEEEEYNDDNNEQNNEDTNDESIGIKEKWKPKRIIKAFEDDSNLSSSKTSMDETNERKKNVFKRNKTDVDIFETIDDNCQSQWNSDEENYVSIFQKNNQQSDLTQICKTPLIKTNVLDFVSPITQLTILHANSNSSKNNSVKKEFVFGNDVDSLSQTPFDTSKNRFSMDKRLGPQKKLFDDYNDVANDEDLMQLCSGAFPSMQTMKSNPISSEQTSSLTMNEFNKDMSDVSKSDKNIFFENDNSQDITLFLEENSVSPSNTYKDNEKEENSKNVEATWNKLSVVLSSDSEDDSNHKGKVKVTKKHPKKLELSDDDDDDEEEEDDNRRVNVQSDEEKVNDDYVDYDSEENEVVLPKKSKNKIAAEFLDEEAELSESDWDSADEDEQDLDKLEMEEGDEDDIDENKVHNQLEKIHMKQMLDQDQREVRMLQELLFEDGDLYTEGSGRERKFKWKNIDKLGDNNDASNVNDDTDGGFDAQENENELEWCKLRHERDKFIKEKKKAVDEEIEKDLEKSEIFNFGVKLLKKKIESKQSDKQDSLENNLPMIEPIMPRNLTDLLNSPGLEGRKNVIKTIMKKRSLLSRGEEELDRLAKRVRLNDTINLAPMNTKNFVFAHVTPSTKTTDDEENENIRKENENESTSNEKTFQRRKRKALASASGLASGNTTTPKRTMKQQEGMDKKRKKIF